MEWWHIFATSKLTSEMCLVIVKEQYLGGWLCFTCLFFCRIAKFKMAAICTSYYANNHISSPITMQIVNVIYGFVCLEDQGILISQNNEHLKVFCNINCKIRCQTNSCDVYNILVMYICNVNSKYLHGLYPQLHCVWIVYLIIILILTLWVSSFNNENPCTLQRTKSYMIYLLNTK